MAKTLTSDAPVAFGKPRPGVIVLARHGEPSLSRKVKLTAAEYRDFWASYEVRGGPSPILGTYSVSSRTLETNGWKGVVQQIAHTNPADDVYYEDAAHVIVQRANVILYFNVTHEKIIGERSDSGATAQTVLKTVLKRLG